MLTFICQVCKCPLVSYTDGFLCPIGEMSHHDVLDATSKGIAVLLCEHSNTERGFLQVFKSKIEEKLKSSGVMVSVSKVDCDPLVVV